jgi:ABC-type protease/lipase transport system fused ATPase/permease subunit
MDEKQKPLFFLLKDLINKIVFFIFIFQALILFLSSFCQESKTKQKLSQAQTKLKECFTKNFFR